MPLKHTYDPRLSNRDFGIEKAQFSGDVVIDAATAVTSSTDSGLEKTISMARGIHP